MSEVLEQYKHLKARSTALKGSATRKLKHLSIFSKHVFLNEAAFEQSNSSPQQTLTDFRTVLNSMNEFCFKLHEDDFDAAEKEKRK